MLVYHDDLGCHALSWGKDSTGVEYYLWLGFLTVLYGQWHNAGWNPQNITVCCIFPELFNLFATKVVSGASSTAGVFCGSFWLMSSLHGQGHIRSRGWNLQGIIFGKSHTTGREGVVSCRSSQHTLFSLSPVFYFYFLIYLLTCFPELRDQRVTTGESSPNFPCIALGQEHYLI